MSALSDITVLDLSHALAGPFASTMLGDYGAEVIKIEPLDGEIARAWGPPFYGDEAAYFVNLNRNKKSLALDLKHPEGKALFFRLLDRADVVLENLRVGTVAKLGIDYARVRERQPRAVYCSISGFGQDGPYRDRAALDLVVQAESGMISITGEPGGAGVRAGVSIADITAGMYAAFGILAALHARQQTGRGQFIDVSMLEGQLGILSGMIGAYLADGIVPGPLGTAYGALLPYQTFRTKTRDIAIGIGSDKLWRTFCPLVGLAQMMDDPRYVTNARRNANRMSLVAALQEAFLTRTYEEWEAVLQPAGIPMGAINTIDQVVDHAQVRARGSLVESTHPVAGSIRMTGPPVRMSDTPGTVRTPAPLLGEHTEEILRDRLGLASVDIARLRDAGVIRAPKLGIGN
ncbi:MAG TPA: CoA transferase [Vicinamibacterales bacterium]|jgi:crotonobetainyl-CoA:carnitine CoA-transferase CaiB-like acyl-CoA transferase|nr:CoA transferase [Vicinamibacterales bacterium]